MFRLTTTVLALLSMSASTLTFPAYAQDPSNATDLGTMVEDQQTDQAAVVDPEEAVELLSEDDLDTLVAPVALYPDALLAQVLVAATFPLQIVQAARLVDDSDGMTDEEMNEAIAAKEFDPSVLVLLSGFPTVVQRMSDDLDWTEDSATP